IGWATAGLRLWKYPPLVVSLRPAAKILGPGTLPALIASRRATSPSMPECPRLRTVVKPLSRSSRANLAPKSTFPVRGSSSRPAFTSVTRTGDWAASGAVENRTKNNAANTVNNLRIRFNPPLRNKPSIFSIMALHRIQQLLRVVSDTVFEHDFDV